MVWSDHLLVQQTVIEGVTVGGPGHLVGGRERQLLLVGIRTVEYERVTSLVHELDARLAPSSHFNVASEWELNNARDPTGMSEDCGIEPWRAKYRHLILARAVVSELARTADPSYAEGLERHRLRLTDVVRTRIAKTHCVLASDLLAMSTEAERVAQGLGLPFAFA